MSFFPLYTFVQCASQHLMLFTFACISSNCCLQWASETSFKEPESTPCKTSLVEYVEVCYSKRVDKRSVMQNPFWCFKSKTTRNGIFYLHCCHASVTGSKRSTLKFQLNPRLRHSFISFMSGYQFTAFLNLIPSFFWRELFLCCSRYLPSFFRLLTFKCWCLWFSRELNSYECNDCLHR